MSGGSRSRVSKYVRAPKAANFTNRAFIVLLIAVAAGCGGGVDGKPIAPPTTPAPAPEPPPQPPTLRAVVWMYPAPSVEVGYLVGDRIRLVAEFEQRVSVQGSQRLAVEIGEHVRLADFSPWVEDDFPPERPSLLQRFEYEVGPDDVDADGISVPADAFDFAEGALLRAGVEIEVEIYAVAPARDSPNPVEPGEPMDTHRVIGTSEPRVCTTEREHALTHSRFVREWNGTPFRVDMIRNFPNFVTEADLVRLLEPIELLDEKIEAQIGYRILEMGDVIPLPEGIRPGWNTDADRFRRTCPLPRDRRQIQGFYMDDTLSWSPGSQAQAHPICGAITYLQPMLTDWPCLECPGDPLTPGGRHLLDAVTLHELFHVLGFVHFDDHDFLARDDGVPMSVPLTWVNRPDAEAVLWADIDLLRCIFPQGG